MFKVAIVGCGKIADQHVSAIARIQDCEVVALCDRESLMARQLGERVGVSRCFSDVGEMLLTSKPDAVHITTPPQSHFALAEQCLNAGSNVYLEKPFTVTAHEAESLIALAQRANLKLTAGHNYQFTLEMLEMRKLVSQGFLGGRPVHVESYWPYDLSDLSYVAPLLASRDHWVRRLPGQLLHNVISHGIARLAEFLEDDLTDIVARAHQSPKLRDLGGEEVLDELRVFIRDKAGTTAFFSFSTQIKPARNELHVCGPSNSISVDQMSGSVIRGVNRSYKSYLTYFVPPVNKAANHLKNACLNVMSFVTWRLYQDAGMKELIQQFYHCIRSGGPTPIPYREIILTARIMDEVFRQIYGKDAPPAAESTLGETIR